MITKALVLIIGLAAIGFILWWFFGKHTTATVTADGDADLQQLDVEVNGGYSPEQVVLKQGVPAVLNSRVRMRQVVWITSFSAILESTRNSTESNANGHD
ncbi:hypothetical protein S101258_00229 [Lactiplantibacillus plantarum subsp. plantarum]|uniref:Uncharacterized protein n=1 Tax=Lactiplantibacillus plantarum subsp. plantarum TaxID=337330 RepID=A0A2S3U9R9_LACPN|nr:hypothetical protein S101258_00229 [Lactiplantibacillus plantarum subsp. plantarum]